MRFGCLRFCSPSIEWCDWRGWRPDSRAGRELWWSETSVLKRITNAASIQAWKTCCIRATSLRVAALDSRAPALRLAEGRLCLREFFNGWPGRRRFRPHPWCRRGRWRRRRRRRREKQTVPRFLRAWRGGEAEFYDLLHRAWCRCTRRAALEAAHTRERQRRRQLWARV